MKELLTLFLTFAKIGGFTFGGGYAMLPIIQRELADKKNYATNEEIVDYYAIGQLTPGVIAVNVATFIGYKRKGIIGGIVSTLGMVFVPVIIISVIAAVLTNFYDNYYVQCALAGIRVAVIATIVKTIINLIKSSVKDIVTASILIFAFILMLFDVPATIVTVVAAVTGIIAGSVKEKGGNIK